MNRHAIAAQWFKTMPECPHSMAAAFVIVMVSSSSSSSVCGDNVNVVIISQLGLVLFRLICPCRPHPLCFEAPPSSSSLIIIISQTMSSMHQQDRFSPSPHSVAANAPPTGSSSNKSSRAAAKGVRENAVRNSNQFLSPNDTEKAKLKVVNGIVSSPENPATVRRLSQAEDSSNTVSWHKRVVVHRVPRSDASRSMFVSSSQSKEGLSSQCCVIV